MNSKSIEELKAKKNLMIELEHLSFEEKAKNPKWLKAMAIVGYKAGQADLKKEYKVVASGYLYNFGDGCEWEAYTLVKEKPKYADEDNNIFEMEHFKKEGFDINMQPLYDGSLNLDKYKGKKIRILIEEL